MDEITPLDVAVVEMPRAELKRIRAETNKLYIPGDSAVRSDLAWALGVAPMTLWNYEHGRHPSASILRRWLADSRPWVRRLARNFAKRYQEMMK